MAAWRGHRAGTRNALVDLLTTAQSGKMRFSEALRSLFTACEYWAAFHNASLPEYFSADAESSLSAAEVAFSTVGLPAIAAVLTSARLRYKLNSPAATQRLIQELEAALSKITEPVDLVLERFAKATKPAD